MPSLTNSRFESGSVMIRAICRCESRLPLGRPQSTPTWLLSPSNSRYTGVTDETRLPQSTRGHEDLLLDNERLHSGCRRGLPVSDLAIHRHGRAVADRRGVGRAQ